MNWRSTYSQKLVSPEVAVKVVQPGDWVTCGLNEPVALIDALSARADLTDVTFYAGESVQGKVLRVLESPSKIRLIISFLNPFTQAAFNEGRFEFLPSFFSSGTRVFAESTIKCNVAFVSVTPPDARGYCSLGTSVDYIKDAIEYIPTVVAEVNDQMPRTCGDTLIHVSRFTYVVENSSPILTYPPPPVDSESETIAALLSQLVEDGATIEAGAGDLVSSAVSCLRKNDIGIHSEMFVHALMKLVKEGVANGSRKSIDRGKAVANMAYGNQEFYEFIAENPAVELRPASYVLNPMVIAKNYKMTAINTGYQVDLLGQVNAESLRGIQRTGVGGQTDFARGAAMSPGGKSIIIIRSTSGKGKFSNIVPYFEPGTPVTSTRCDIDYVITEYGIARLSGRTTRDRARALISIANPAFRDYLEEEARKLRLL